MTDRDLLKQALEALERCVSTCFDQRAHEEVMSRPEHFVNQNIAALRERLAQPEQEPVVWMYQDKSTHEVRFQKHMRGFVDHGATYETPLYTTPPRREWVGLTDEEKLHLEIMGGKSDVMLAEAIEAKLKEKNNG